MNIEKLEINIHNDNDKKKTKQTINEIIDYKNENNFYSLHFLFNDKCKSCKDQIMVTGYNTEWNKKKHSKKQNRRSERL